MTKKKKNNNIVDFLIVMIIKNWSIAIIGEIVKARESHTCFNLFGWLSVGKMILSNHTI